MTTLTAIKGKDYILIGADTRVSQGNLKLPFPFSKTQIICENILVSGAGSVGNLQRVLDIALRNARIEKAYLGEAPLELEDVVKHLSELNFQLPLEYKHFSPFSFIVGGLNSEGQTELYSIGDDGSVIKIPSYYSDGSGSQLALSILGKAWNEDLTIDEAKLLILEALEGSSSHDLYTNNHPEIFSLKVDDEKWEIEKLVKKKEEKVEEKKE